VTRAYLSLGSNLGNRFANIVAAVRALKDTHRVAALSPIYETAPLGPDGAIVRDQPAYLNCVVVIETAETAAQLRTRTSAIETAMGRRAGERWRPRPIDIDIVLFGNERIENETLVVPHPRLHERAFVVQPLLDLDPAIVVPGVGALAPLRRGLLWQDVHESVSAEEFVERVERAE
jgi:2-amino-4-hydroxy-6-hydroxymethyldihydropteridine diphosphokinase